MTRTADIYYPGNWQIGGAEAHVLHLARSLSRSAQVRLLVTSPCDQPSLRKTLRIGGASVEVVHLKTGSEAEIHRTSKSDLFVNCSPWAYVMPPPQSTSAMLIYYAPALRQPSMLRRVLKAAVQWRRHINGAATDPQQAVLAYDRIFSASRWTGALVEQRWNRRWDLLYPAVSPIRPHLGLVRKEPLVLSVGRIGAGGTDKGHLAMSEIFRDMQLKNWTFVVAGATNCAATDAVADEIESRGSGRVLVVRNPSAEALEQLYCRAALYWHAAGMNAPPGAIAHEHFGISIVEAMSARAVPLAHATGGPTEILVDGLRRCLWASEAELRQSTQRMVDDPNGLATLGAECLTRSQAFSPEAFDVRVDELVGAMFA